MVRGKGQRPDDVHPEEQTLLWRINSKNYLSPCLAANQIFLSHKHSILGQKETSRHTAPPVYCGFFQATNPLDAVGLGSACASYFYSEAWSRLLLARAIAEKTHYCLPELVID